VIGEGAEERGDLRGFVEVATSLSSAVAPLSSVDVCLSGVDALNWLLDLRGFLFVCWWCRTAGLHVCGGIIFGFRQVSDDMAFGLL